MSNKRHHLPSLEGKHVLVTGGLGFIGSNLARQCLELGARVTIYDCLDPSSGGNLYNIHDIRDSVEVVFNDILNLEGVACFVAESDILFNCAASTSHPFSMRMPFMDIDANSKGVMTLLEAARRYNRGIKFVHLGTSTQLGPIRSTPADEGHPEFPMDIYSANKSASEKYVLIYGRAYGMAVTVVRLSNVFGPRASIHSSDFTFVNFFVGLALQDRVLTVYRPGTQLRNVLFVEDAVNALILASCSAETDREVFFAVSDEHLSVVEIARTVVEVLGKGRVEMVDWPSERKAIEFGDAVLSNRKIRSVLGWEPLHSLRSGLEKTREYYLPRLQHYLP